MTKKTIWIAIAIVALAASLVPAIADDEFEGEVELLYRNVSVSGSENKYEEDFDGLSSGLILGSLAADWRSTDSGWMDYASIDLFGLGGNPYESAALKAGRKDRFEISFNHWKQDYRYDLFELVPDEDGALWNSERQTNELNLRIFPTEKVQLFFNFRQIERSGMSLFMKDIQRNVFRLEAPLDAEAKHYTVGAKFEIGRVDLLFKQTLRRYDNRFDNLTEADLGLEGNSQLDKYEWLQRDLGSSDLTTLKAHAPLGDRVNLSVALHGDFLGDEELKSRVNLEAYGLDFSGGEFGGTCLANPGTACASDATCDAITPGDVCVFNEGFSTADLEADTTLIEANLSVEIIEPLNLLLQYRSLERDVAGTLSRDLDGDGTLEDPDGDATAGSTVVEDYSIDTLSAILEYRPNRKVGVRGGLRTIDRELMRNGFGSLRDTDYKSDGDETLVLGFWVRPVDWFRLNADYEDGDVDQPFNAVAPQESEHLRVRASFLPQDDMRVDLTYLDFSKTNTALDIRDPGSNWDSDIEGSTWSVLFSHKASEKVDYLFRYATQEIDSRVGIVFDTAGFAVVEAGDSIFDNDNEQILGQVNYSWATPWRLFLRYWMTESDGNNIVLGDTSGTVNDQIIAQEYTNAELGLTYSFPSGLFFGGTIRDFDYDDDNNLLDYDGQILELRGGFRF